MPNSLEKHYNFPLTVSIGGWSFYLQLETKNGVLFGFFDCDDSTRLYGDQLGWKDQTVVVGTRWCTSIYLLSSSAIAAYTA